MGMAKPIPSMEAEEELEEEEEEMEEGEGTCYQWQPWMSSVHPRT